MNRRMIFCAISICLIGMSSFATIPPSHSPAPVLGGEFSDLFSGTGSGHATVISKVYSLGPTAGGYLYTYQITGATANFTWFSVALNPGMSIDSCNSDETFGIKPIEWLPVEDYTNPNSIEAFFKNGLTSGNSALLWFTTSDGPTPGLGALARLSANGGAYAEGTVLVPVPEPLTVTLLGFGWLAAVRSFRRK
jgi:hypothetical protein